MKIKLLFDIPVKKEHGMTEGRVLEILEEDRDQPRGQKGVWVMGDTGERVKILKGEYERID